MLHKYSSICDNGLSQHISCETVRQRVTTVLCGLGNMMQGGVTDLVANWRHERLGMI